MRVLLSGGGTGGHITPALAIAETIKRNVSNAEIAFVGTPRGLENKLIPNAGYSLYHVNIQGIRRSLSPSNLKTAYLTLTSPHKAAKIIKDFAPDVVIGTGGYVCWPTLKAASHMGIPTLLHESNAVPGVAIRQLQKAVDVILVNFEESARYFQHPEKVVHVGNPLSGDFGRMDQAHARKKLGIPEECHHVVLSYGGSLGATRMNDAALSLMAEYTAKQPQIYHMHATGRIDGDVPAKRFAELGLDSCNNLMLSEYLFDMPTRMAAADVVICRAGAMTLSEIAAMNKAAILIPSPNVTDNHQYKNAKVLADAGAAILLEERELSEGKLAQTVRSLLEDDARRHDMQTRVAAFANRDADKKIYEEICKLLKKA